MEEESVSEEGDSENSVSGRETGSVLAQTESRVALQLHPAETVELTSLGGFFFLDFLGFFLRCLVDLLGGFGTGKYRVSESFRSDGETELSCWRSLVKW